MLPLNPEHFTLHCNDRLTLRVKQEYDYSFAVPNYVPDDFRFNHTLAAIIHIYYTDLVDEIILYISNIPTQTDLFISTDSEYKKLEIINKLKNYQNGKVCVRVFPNRGRDIAPTFVGFRDVFNEYEYFIHLHSKKSLYNSELDVWRGYLFNSLLGSSDIIKTILWQLSQPNIGIVFAQHFEKIRPFVNCCLLDYIPLKKLLSKSGIELDEYNYIDFPSSSMFWGRSSAIKLLLQQNLTWEDFPNEDGQIYGTLAHAIERSILFFVEKSGFKWVKIANNDLIQTTRRGLIYKSYNEFNSLIDSFFISVITKQYNLFSKTVYYQLNQIQHELNQTKLEVNELNQTKHEVNQTFERIRVKVKKLLTYVKHRLIND